MYRLTIFYYKYLNFKFTIKFAMEFGTERMQFVLNTLLGSPQRKYNVIHVTGTNGKGSTCAILYEILSQLAQYSVYGKRGMVSAPMVLGMFTSPPLVRPGDNIVIQGVPISEKSYIELKGEIESSIREWNDGSSIDGQKMHLTSFELQTAVALTWFARNNVTLSVIEVGMGGKLDCTNVFSDLENGTEKSQVLACVMTSISMEHIKELGPGWKDIVQHKLGISKPRVPFFITKQNDVFYESLDNIIVSGSALEQYISSSCSSPTVFIPPCQQLSPSSSSLSSKLFFKSTLHPDIAIEIPFFNMSGTMQWNHLSVAIEIIIYLYIDLGYFSFSTQDLLRTRVIGAIIEACRTVH
jgi:folylpolyglutamate synthase/dihydropteroate synthase